MEKKGFKWQMIIEIVLLLGLSVFIIFPAIKFNAEKYVDWAIDVNNYAVDEDEDNAKAAQRTVDKYADEKEQNNKVQELEDSEVFSDKGITYFDFANKLISGKTGLDSDLITESDKGLNKNEAKSTFIIYGILIYAQLLLFLIVIIVILANRKTSPVLFLSAGLFSFLIDIYWLFIFPGSVWDGIEEYVDSFELIANETLQIDKVGSYAMGELAKNVLDYGFFYHLIGAGVVVLFGILLITALKPGASFSDEDEDWDFIDIPNGDFVPPHMINAGVNVGRMQDTLGGNVPGSSFVQDDFKTVGIDLTEAKNPNEIDPSIFSVDPQLKDESTDSKSSQANIFVAKPKQDNKFLKKVHITCVQGEFAGETLEITDGEELRIGRNPAKCQLVLSNPKVSRRHVGIIYSASINKYLIKNYSENGTYIYRAETKPDGSVKFISRKPINVGTYREAVSGNYIFIAGGSERFYLE
ncbi:MAG: FHA domain-containing protein [Lachnospiraceae bacterium]|nr:FHA domain-containing protein [Lachnospiraceae bacterium]